MNMTMITIMKQNLLLCVVLKKLLPSGGNRKNQTQYESIVRKKKEKRAKRGRNIYSILSLIVLTKSTNKSNEKEII